MEKPEKNRVILIVSVLVIVAFWVFSIITTTTSKESIPDFFKFFWSIIYKKSAIIGVLLFLLFLGETSLTSIGFSWKAIGRRMILGFGMGILALIVMNVVLSPIAYAINPEPFSSTITSYFQRIDYYPFWIIMAVYAGGFSEELERIFVMTQFEKLFGKYGLIFSIIVGSLVFGIGHMYQGTNAAFTTGIFGLLMALLYLRKRSAIEPIVAHASYDIIQISLGFFLYYR